MRHLAYTLFILACAWGIELHAQTPYDSFAPETSRPMLGILGQELLTDSILCAVVADMQNQILLLVDVSNGEVIATAPLTDDVRKWLSVDPLADKYPNISPYAYCAWNPVGFVDPDGRFPLDSPLLRYLALAMTMENSQGNSNVKTVGYTMQHPINSLRTGDAKFPPGSISNIACRFQVNLEKEAGFSAGIGGQSNAYRHTFWQAMLANSFGSEEAVKIGNAHEDYLPQDMSTRIFSSFADADLMVDLLNNIGRGIVENNKGHSNKQYAELVLKEYKDNGLWIVTGNAENGFFVQKSKLTQEQYNRALQVVKTRGNNGLLE